MRAGGQKEKGSKWERETGKLLSLWLTRGDHPDIFSRNVLSGGSFTRASDAGRITARAPGDLMAAHPLAFAFLSRFSVECKHLKDIGLEPWLFDPKAGGDLGRIITLAERQARSIDLHFMLIAKQNHREALVLIDGVVGRHLLKSSPLGRTRLTPMHHFAHKDRICIIRFCDMIAHVDPTRFLGTLA